MLNNITITSNSAEVKNVSIFNVLGKNVLSTSVSSNRAEINTSLLSSGIYIIKVQEGVNTATSKLVIK
ncbi:T9SS type A sorting domain-containing protein [Polaribacter sp.]|uniref:T9SS type A sorting domain-containing protein n=1 Tax=Polaribacter sp. TaxID=1920175 RepID=UPI0025E00CD9|nr:T9SS type A sorting domain-containing protein [Polaribacter sp.]